MVLSTYIGCKEHHARWGIDLPVMSKPSVRERLAGAAFELFDERGYEQTTVDDITGRAGLGRTTFFRHYRSKEDVIFPDHDRLLEQIADRLRTSSHGAALVAVSDAVRLVLLHYIGEGAASSTETLYFGTQYRRIMVLST